MEKNESHLQQGDVTLEAISDIPTDAKLVQPGAYGLILAHGEHTGHKHRIAQHEDMAWMYEKDGELYVKALKTVTVTHEEHKPVTVPAGIWKVGQVFEKDYFKDMIRKVVD